MEEKPGNYKNRQTKGLLHPTNPTNTNTHETKSLQISHKNQPIKTSLKTQLKYFYQALNNFLVLIQSMHFLQRSDAVFTFGIT